MDILKSFVLLIYSFKEDGGLHNLQLINLVKWLYPYVVIEFPVSFLRLVKDIYNESGIYTDVYIQQYYHNITGYVLPEGPPTYPTFGTFIEERGVYEATYPIHSERRVHNDFIPDHVAYDLVKDVYANFWFR